MKGADRMHPNVRAGRLRTLRTSGARGWIVVIALALRVAATLAAPQTPPSPRLPREPPPTKSFSPFRDPGFGGITFNAAALEQEDCPLGVSIVRISREDPNTTSVSVRLANITDATLSHYAIGAWVIVSDGTVRGLQRYQSGRRIAGGASRTVDLIVRTITLLPGDTIVVAVQEAVGGPEPWRRDVQTIESDVRSVVVR